MSGYLDGLLRRMFPVVLRTLREREEALRAPFPADGDLTRVLAVVDIPLWFKPHHSIAVLEMLEADGSLVRDEDGYRVVTSRAV